MFNTIIARNLLLTGMPLGTRCVGRFCPLLAKDLIHQQLSHGSNEQYPSLLLMRRRLNCTNPGEGFGDLHHWGFVSMASHVSCCKLEWLILGPYQQAVLHRSVSHQEHCDKVESWEMLMGMEYAGSVGTMVMDELAEVNERVSGAVNGLKTKTEDLGWDYNDLNGCFEVEKEKVVRLEEIAQMKAEHHLLRWEFTAQKEDMTMLTTSVLELLDEV